MLSSILTAFFSALLGWLTRHFQEWWKDEQARKTSEAKNEELRKALENANTKEERDKAAADIAAGFGK